jgi:hypothetical protein
VRLVALQSIVCSEAARPSGYLAPAMLSLFPAELRGISSLPAPVLFRVRVHPLVRLPPLQSTDRVKPARDPFEPRAPSLGFPSPSRHEHQESTLDELPRSSSFRPQRFSRSRRLTPLDTSWACFIPLPRPGFTLQGIVPAAKPTRLVVVPSPLVGWRPSPPAGLPRLSSSDHPAFRVLIQAAIRCCAQGV